MDVRSRLLVLIVGLCLLFSARRTTAQDASNRSESTRQPAEPDVRYVVTERASIYAGPSEDYYPTSVLKEGDTVEAFQQTTDGWLAIRPPKGSFSWLPATQGFLLPGGRVVEVTDAEAVSWIGSSLGTAKQYRWQVRLSRGEQLNVIGEQTLGDEQSDKKTLWYKIAPPNGEFRWIRSETVSDAASPNVRSEIAEERGRSEKRLDAKVTTAGAIGEDGSQSILQASAEEPIDDEVTYTNESQMQPAGSRQGAGGAARTGQDRWSTWHAIEFQNGTFSFPGIARMLGMEPAPTRAADDGYDPFDLATAATMGKPLGSNDNVHSSPGAQDSTAATAVSDDSKGPMGPRKTRGWRDPRELRESREREWAGEQLTGGGNFDGAYAVDQSAVGSAVITASANATVGSVDDAQWYGVVQAPQVANYQPMQLQHADLSQVQALLSEMVSGPEHTWNLAPLADRTRYLIEHGVTAIERGEARLLLDRIEAFADLARRSTELGMTPPVALPASVNASLSASPIAAAANRWASPLGLSSAVTDASSGSAPRFDATGWVVPVHSSNPEMPTHALTNDTGRIIVYLTPAAGVNLARYQAQAVGVYGLRGYLPQLKANHIQVQRAVRLQ